MTNLATIDALASRVDLSIPYFRYLRCEAVSLMEGRKIWINSQGTSGFRCVYLRKDGENTHSEETASVIRVDWFTVGGKSIICGEIITKTRGEK